jgi:CTD kinase subunit gamma CTK3
MPLDPFEGRLQFLEQLKHLSASQSSSLKLAQFALKNRTLHEDLYSCIIEKLPSTTLNDKINIFYFLGTLVDQSERAQFGPYGDMVRRDLDRIVSDVAPVDGGAVNIPPAKKVCLRSCRLTSGPQRLTGQAVNSADVVFFCSIYPERPGIKVSPVATTLTVGHRTLTAQRNTFHKKKFDEEWRRIASGYPPHRIPLTLAQNITGRNMVDSKRQRAGRRIRHDVGNDE